MRLFCILAGAALMTVGLSGCGGGIQEGIEPNVDMTKTYPTPANADMSGAGQEAVDEAQRRKPPPRAAERADRGSHAGAGPGPGRTDRHDRGRRADPTPGVRGGDGWMRRGSQLGCDVSDS